MLDKRHSAKLALPSLFLTSAVRRVLHLANYLPSVLCLLPSVSGTRQTQESGSDRYQDKRAAAASVVSPPLVV